jgi:hypothetical protein
VDTRIGSDPRPYLLDSSTRNHALHYDARRALQRECCTGNARRFVVSMMEIDPTALGVGYRARFVFRKRQCSARHGRLAKERQDNGCEPQRAARRNQ